MPEDRSEEVLNTPDQQIRTMGRDILQAVDEIIEENGWSWSKQPPSEIQIPADATAKQLGKLNLLRSPFSLGRRFKSETWLNTITGKAAFQPEAVCMEQVLENGMIPVVQLPNRQPYPRGIIINIKGAPEYWDWRDEGAEIYKERTTRVLEELLRKIGFLENFEALAAPSPRKTFHTYDQSTGLYSSKNVAGESLGEEYSYDWIAGTNQFGENFIEIRHFSLPFVADVIESEQLEPPPLVIIKYIHPQEFGEQSIQGVLDEVEEMLRQAKNDQLLTDEQLKAETEKIITKKGKLNSLLDQYPKHSPFFPTFPGKAEQRARLADGSTIFENNEFVTFYTTDQPLPQKFELAFFGFKDTEYGLKHPYAEGVETDNLFIINYREKLDQPWKTGKYYINPKGVLCKIPLPKEGLYDGVEIYPNTLRELNVVNAALDLMINKMEQELLKSN